MGRIARRVSPSQTIEVINEDPNDNRILECAAEAGSDYVVSGDNDLLRLGQYGAIRVLKVADMLDVVLGKGWRNPGRQLAWSVAAKSTERHDTGKFRSAVVALAVATARSVLDHLAV